MTHCYGFPPSITVPILTSPVSDTSCQLFVARLCSTVLCQSFIFFQMYPVDSFGVLQHFTQSTQIHSVLALIMKWPSSFCLCTTPAMTLGYDFWIFPNLGYFLLPPNTHYKHTLIRHITLQPLTGEGNLITMARDILSSK